MEPLKISETCKSYYYRCLAYTKQSIFKEENKYWLEHNSKFFIWLLKYENK